MTDEKTRWAFKRLFATDEGAVVLRVLAEFARADEAEFCSDPRKDAGAPVGGAENQKNTGGAR